MSETRACVPAVERLLDLATETRPDLDRDRLHGLVTGARTAGIPWPWLMRTIVWSLADPGHDLHDIRTAVYARQPGRNPRAART